MLSIPTHIQEVRMIRKPERDESHDPATYEPPAVEEVLKAEELDREVLYAGVNGSIPPPP
jgi:hypothetical protein